ncbi:MAG: TonB-dependent receptor [Fermentimonas sp.]|nr:TonB-dependent receptor [Fermentimonas sp.]
MKRKISILVKGVAITLLWAFSLLLSAQNILVSGRVTDVNNEPLIGVTVQVIGTVHGTVTDADGTFTITNVPSNAQLEISYVGMISQVIPVNGRQNIQVTLLDDTELLEEVVVVGYGTMKKSDLTGSVENITSERLLDRPAFNVAQALSGKVAGLKIVERSGAPGGIPMIRIRGTNSINSSNDPLFVVDDVVGVSNALTILNPNEIASIDVLKDASATAIYGARGANGVIIITTKRGTEGKPRVTYDGYVSQSYMQRRLNVLNNEQFFYVIRQAYMNVGKYASNPNWSTLYDAALLPDNGAGRTTYAQLPHLFEQTSANGYSVPLLGNDGNYYKPRFENDWEGETFRPATSTNHQIGITGGNKDALLGLFLGYTNNNGLLINSNFERFSGRMTGDMKLTDWFNINSYLSLNRSKERTNDVSYFSGGMARSAIESYPMLPIRYPDDPETYGTYAGQYSTNADFPMGEVDCQSPIAISNGVETFTRRTQVNGAITMNFIISPHLTFKSNLAMDILEQKYYRYANRKISRSAQGAANLETWKNYYWQNENYFNYNNQFGDHSLIGLLGASWSRYTGEYLGTWNDHFFDDFYGWHNIGIGSATRPAPSSNDNQSSLNSYFARINYDFQGKYLFTVTGRVDGSSKFGKNNKYGFFPSASAAWRISEEDFLNDIEGLSNAKIRASIGQTGNQEIGSYVTQTFIGSGNVPLGNSGQPGLWPNSVGNPDLRWEKTTQYDFGLDLGVFDNRIILTFDYYNKLTEDMLLDVPLPQSTTTGSVRLNYGKIRNEGIEATLSTHNIKTRDFNWYTDINFARNVNTIEQLGPTGADILRNWWVGGANTILREGLSVAQFFGLNRLGTYGTNEASLAARYGMLPGDVKYEDRNNDGRISFVEDGIPMGSAFPKWDINLHNSMDYRNFDFTLDLKISYGAKKENRTNHSSEDRQGLANGKTSILDAWRPDHQNTMVAQVRPGNGGAYYQTYPDTRWIEDASFIRGDGMTLGYTFPKAISNSIGASRFRVYLNASNFFLLTKYSGYDPEGSDNDNMDSITPGMDFFMYPRPSNYSFGVNLTF